MNGSESRDRKRKGGKRRQALVPRGVASSGRSIHVDALREQAALSNRTGLYFQKYCFGINVENGLEEGE